MSTTIEWTQRPGTKGETWNPVVGCTKVSAGCKNCYAKRIHDNRHKAYTEGKMQNLPQYASPFEAVQLMHERVALPLSWKKPRTIFVNSVSDLFHPDVPFDFIDRVFAIMALTPQHTYQVLTKRPERMAEYFGRKYHDHQGACVTTSDEVLREANAMHDKHIKPLEDWLYLHTDELGGWPLPNVWLGTSVENQATADARIPHLLRCPAAIRFLSCEPLLGPVNFLQPNYRPAYWNKEKQSGGWHDERIHWVITGGESGPQARPMHPNWARSLRYQCAAAGVPFFFKQWGEFGSDWRDGNDAPVFRAFRTFEQWVNKASTWVAGGICIDKNGKQLHNGRDMAEARDNDAFPVTIMHKVGKHASGNLLDGTTHSAFPLPTPHPLTSRP